MNYRRTALFSLPLFFVCLFLIYIKFESDIQFKNYGVFLEKTIKAINIASYKSQTSISTRNYKQYQISSTTDNQHDDCSKNKLVLHGMMTAKEINYLKSYIKKDSNYLEWGSGGSTDTFGRLTSGKIVSVENYDPWCKKVSQTPFVNCRLSQNTMDYYCVIPHETGNAGYPLDSAHNGDFMEYITVVENYPNFDILLVDGRWRVACALFALDYIKDDTVVFFHDFSRQEYFVVLEYYDKIGQVDSLVALSRKKNGKRPTKEEMDKYFFSPGP